jgi:hypothetical protein
MAFVLWNPQSVTVTRPVPAETQDSGGGFVAGAPMTIYSGVADVLISRGVNEHRDEAEPGISTQKIRQFEFLRPISYLAGATRFLPEDLVAWSSEIYTVQFVWEYDDLSLVEGWVLQ